MTDTQTHCCTGPVDDRQLQDPVCGMRVTPRSPFSYKLLDKTYYFCSKRCLSQFQAAFIRVSNHTPAEDQQALAEQKDPVCGMAVAADSKLTHKHAGKTYRFCSSHCLEKFKSAPAQYLGDISQAATTAQPVLLR